MRSWFTENIYYQKKPAQQSQILTKFLSAQSLGVGVKAEQDTLVLQRVLVLRPRTLLNLGTCRTDYGLNFVAVD